MKTQNRKSQLTDIVALARRALTARTMSAAVVVTTMMLALIIMAGARSSIAAVGPTSLRPNPSAVAPASSTVCAGGLTLTYYDSTRGDVPVLFTPYYGYAFSGGVSILKGYLYLPESSTVAASPKNLPLIVFNHGSDLSAGEQCEMAAYFSGEGFAFFVPHRRGHGLSTGVYYTDFLDQVCHRTDQNPFGTCGRVQNNSLLLDYLQDQTFEVAQAISYLSSLTNSAHQPIINPNKVAIMGHSFGGMVTLFNNNVLTNHRAAVDIAGASESWDYFDRDDGNNTPDDSPSIDKLRAAVRGANKPIFFFEPKNDVSIRPTVVLSNVAGNHEERYQAAIYGPVPGARDGEEAHGKFVTDHDEVQKWGPAVIEFLSRFGVK
jgi:alpha-beta hydrolase superfamily lysophospholipase